MNRKFISILLAAVLIIISFPGEIGKKAGMINEVKADSMLSNPRIETDSSLHARQKVTYDCVWFGSYPQIEIVDKAQTSGAYDLGTDYDYIVDPKLYNELELSGGWIDNEIIIDGEKYRRLSQEDTSYHTSGDIRQYNWRNDSFHYFKYEPIKWRVLSVDANKVFLFSDIILDCRVFNSASTNTTWENSSIRNWLNGIKSDAALQDEQSQKSFINDAFSSSQQKAICHTTLDDNNSIELTESNKGDNSSNMIFLLSDSETCHTDLSSSYGFYGDDPEMHDEARIRKSSSFAKAMGVYCGVSVNGRYWLRSPGDGYDAAECIHDGGNISKHGNRDYNGYGVKGISGVCPALYLDTSFTDVWAYAGTVSTDGTVNEAGEGSEDIRLTSTTSRFRENYNNLINGTGNGKLFSGYAKGLKHNDNAAIIPGLETTNMGGFGKKLASTLMVPQGVCVAGQYLLISAYEYKNTNGNPCVIYVLDQKTKKYLTTLVLTNSDDKDTNTIIKSHVGAIAYDKQGTVFITDSNIRCIWKLPVSKINTAVRSGKDAVVTKLTDSFPVEINPSFINYYGGNLFIGNHKKVLLSTDEMMIYDVNGDKKTDKTIQIPGQCQGVGITEIGKYTYLFCSCSRGREDLVDNIIPNYSRLVVYRFQKQKNGKFDYLLTNNAVFGSSTGGNQVKLFLGAPMSEDIEIQGNTIYTCHESGSNGYNTSCCYPLDIITEGSASKYVALPSSLSDAALLAMSVKSERQTAAFTEDVDVIDEGYCGDDAYYVLYSNGVMNITGGGAINDYSGEEPPWKAHINEIRELYIGADINVIGTEAFKGAASLEKVEVSTFSSEDEILEIRDKTFDGCNNLDELVLPEKEYRISDDSFSSTPTVYSDDADVLNYAQEKELQIHKHEFVLRDKVASTCGTQGYSIYACTCGEEEYRDITDPGHSSHTYKEIDHVDATEKTGGYTEYICTVCGEGKLDTTDPTGTSEEGTTAAPSEATTEIKKDTKINKIKISGISKQIAAGKTIQLTAAVLPKEAANTKLEWSSSNKKIATVSSAGKVKIKKGTGGKSVTITAKATDGSGKSAVFKIKVMKGTVKSIKIKGAKKTLKVGKTMKLKATVKVSKGKPVNKKVKWTSNNPKYATVSSKGVVKALKDGKGKKVTITVHSTDGTGKKKKIYFKIK